MIPYFAVPDLDPSPRDRRLPGPVREPRVRDRATVFPHLASGRVMLALAAPQAVIWVWCWWWITPQLADSGAVLRNGQLAWPASASIPVAPVATVAVLAWLVGMWSLGVALVVMSEEAQGRVPRWRSACGWPRRYPWAVPAVAGLSVLALLLHLAVAALLLFAFLTTAMPLPFGLGVLVILLASVDAALVWLHRRAYALIVIGTRRWPGAVDAVPPVRGTSRSAGPVVWWTMAGTISLGLLVQHLAHDIFGAPAWVSTAVTGLIVGIGTAMRTVGIANDVLPDDLPVLDRRRGPWQLSGRWLMATALLAVPALTLVLTPRIHAWNVLSYQEIEAKVGATEIEVEIGGDTTMMLGMIPDYRTTVRCGPRECDPGGPVLAYADRTVAGDGAIWEVAWETDAEAEFQPWSASDPDTPITLTLTSPTGGSRDLMSSTVGELSGHLEGASLEGLLQHSPLAMAERDGVVAVLALGAAGTASPLHLFVCTERECTSASTSVSRHYSMHWYGTALAIGPDGTVSAAISSVAAGEEDSGMLFVHLDDTGTLTTELVPSPAEDGEYRSDSGISLAIGSDSTPWVLYLPEAGSAHLVRCDDPTCATRDVTRHDGIGQGLSALVVDGSNRPLIASAWEAHGAIRLLSCPDQACTTLTEVRLWDTRSAPTGDSGRYPNVHVGIGLEDDRPVIAVSDSYRLAGGDRLIRCDAPRCGAD